MKQTSSSAPSQGDASTGKRTGLLESAVQKLFTRRAQIVMVEELNPTFRMITLGGDALKKAEWTPGDKIQIQLGGWVQRTYTPLDWDGVEGRARILVYLHGDGPGTRWAAGARAGDDCVLFGPRRSIDLTRLRSPAILFGDETSFGLAAAWKGVVIASGPVEMLFEISTSAESRSVIEQLGLGNVNTSVRAGDDAHLPSLDDRILVRPSSLRSTQFVLTGKSTSIQRIRRLLRQRNVASSQFQSKAYWAPGKAGLD